MDKYHEIYIYHIKCSAGRPGSAMGRRKQERRIEIIHTGMEDAGEIRLKLLKLISRGIKERTRYNGEGDRETEQHRYICQDKQG